MTSNCGCSYCTFNRLLKADLESSLKSAKDNASPSKDAPEITAGYWRKGTIAPERNRLVIGLRQAKGTVDIMYWTGQCWCNDEYATSNAPDLWIYIP